VLTVEYKVNFPAPAWGERLVVRGEVITAGGRLFVCKAEVVAISAEGEKHTAQRCSKLWPPRLRKRSSVWCVEVPRNSLTSSLVSEKPLD
jgi:hypothetical protein